MKTMISNLGLAMLGGLLLIGWLGGCEQQSSGPDATLQRGPDPSLSPEPVASGPEESAGEPEGPPGRPVEEPPPASPGEPATIEFALAHVDRQPTDHLAQARALLADEDPAGAMLELAKALYDQPTDLEAAMLLGRLARDNGRKELAVDAFMLATQIEPSADGAWLELARMSLTAGQLDQAEQLVRRALQLNPERALAHNVLGRIWLNRAHWERAIACFEKALQLSPSNSYFRNNLGYAWLLKRDFGRAVQVLEPLAARSGLPAFMYNNLGLAYEGSGRLQEAIGMFRRSLATRPGYVNAQVNLDRLVQLAKRDAPPPEDETVGDEPGSDEPGSDRSGTEAEGVEDDLILPEGESL